MLAKIRIRISAFKEKHKDSFLLELLLTPVFTLLYIFVCTIWIVSLPFIGIVSLHKKIIVGIIDTVKCKDDGKWKWFLIDEGGLLLSLFLVGIYACVILTAPNLIKKKPTQEATYPVRSAIQEEQQEEYAANSSDSQDSVDCWPRVDPYTDVYVSRNDIVHKRHNCSGMIYYKTMPAYKAYSRGYQRCSKCW